MNHRMLFFISLIVIIVGVAGILLQYKPPAEPATEDSVSLPVSVPEKKITFLAQASRELKPYDLLSLSDYKIKEIEVHEDAENNRGFSSEVIADLRGYLILENIAEGGIISPEMAISPRSPEFIQRSLRDDETPYAIKVNVNDEFILTTLKVGQKITLILRAEESNNSRAVANQTAAADDGMSTALGNDGVSTAISSAVTQFFTQPLMSSIDVIDIKKYENPSNTTFRDNNIAGEVIVRVDAEQIATLRTVEKSGEILISLTKGSAHLSDKRTQLSDILPSFRTVRELRGKN
ncbi:hypothetical protein [Erwinia sp. ErVv1]|uniref:hypothetical protein n=1 Tax=Erwinia sp. ErVv1 TaxID=1603299 RepID=UPI00082AA96A|nr:hypothetical protein [Erwinia sp. ErVv1]